MNVLLLACTPAPDKLVALAAKNCYSSSTIDKLSSGLTDEKTASFIDMLGELGHESPIEHASFTFGIEGVSRSLLAQLTRHRIASFSVKSQRYNDEGAFQYVIPPEVEAIPEAKERFISAIERIREDYRSISDMLFDVHSERLSPFEPDEKAAKSKARKAANEDARYLLPNACSTQIVMTMNARSLNNFFRLRMCTRAQWEIRELAERMRALVISESPGLFKNAGPACLSGPCQEGPMCCGRMLEMRERFLGDKGG